MLLKRLTVLAFLIFFGSGATVSAHNNPAFREDLLLTLDISAEPISENAYSQPFTLSWPKKTVQLIWRVISDNPQNVTFAVAQEGTTVLENMQHEDASRRLQGDGLTIVDVSGTGAPFKLEVYAKVLDSSKQKQHENK
jgi:hypothetical protein